MSERHDVCTSDVMFLLVNAYKILQMLKNLLTEREK